MAWPASRSRSCWPTVVAPRIGAVTTADGEPLEATGSLENSPPVLFDAVVLPDGPKGVEVLLGLGQALEYATLTWRHGKTLLALGAGRALIEKAQVPTTLGDGSPDPGVLFGSGDDKTAQAFIAAVAKHRHPQREGDPPRV